jgi:hypothetical protein
MEPERNSSSMIPSYQHRGKEETSSRSGLNDRERGELKSNQIGLASKAQSFQDSVNSHEVKVTKVSPPRRKANRDEQSERQSNYMKKEEISRTVVKQQQQLKPQQQRLSSTLASHVSSKQSEKESSYEVKSLSLRIRHYLFLDMMCYNPSFFFVHLRKKRHWWQLIEKKLKILWRSCGK